MRTNETNRNNIPIAGANTKKIIIIVTCICLLLISGQVFAVNCTVTATVGKVTGVGSLGDAGGFAVRTDFIINPYNCTQSNHNVYVIDRTLPNAKEMISLVISALLSGKNVNFCVGPCMGGGGAPTIGYVDLINDNVPFGP